KTTRWGAAPYAKQSNSQSVVIPQATAREHELLTAVAPAYTAERVVHVPAPGVIGTDLSSTPPDTAVANAVERPIAVTVATRKGCEASFVGCSGVGVIP